ncbi:MAG: class I SAM-dependent methyltransferase [Euryarchaeota archaeon]|nr:class I SAM-dependent methyltransferase [Euryarchaeota archaeon]
MKSKGNLGEIINAKSNKEVVLLYDKYAKTYDADLEKVRTSNQGAIYIVEMFKKYVPLDGVILDAGNGTGGVVELLHHQGFLNLVGIEISSGMLDEANKKNVYSDLRVCILGEDIDSSPFHLQRMQLEC